VGPRPPSDWDESLDLDEVIDLDEHELDFKLGLDRVGKGAMRPANIASIPREEGEGFYEDMEERMDKITIQDILNKRDVEEPYDFEDLSADGDWDDEEFLDFTGDEVDFV
jgi:hypothetical protein